MSGRLTRRQFMGGIGGVTLGITALSAGAARASTATPTVCGFPTGALPEPDDEVAAAYYQLLLRHTNWVEQQWDADAGHFSGTDYNFAVVLGNAVLLTHGTYDADLAGVDAATLKSQTLATITHFAASNLLTGGTEWGETMFFDSTFELYFVLGAKLLWDDLDDATRANVDTIAAAQAAYTTALGAGDDPRSPSWSPNGLAGNWQGDTKVDEMAVYAQCLGPAVAWLPDHPDAATWRTWLDTWLLNDTGLPPADQANPTVVAGKTIASRNTAHNIFDTFFVENHGSFEPHYQLETWRMSARVAAHFLAAGRPLPAALTAKPNGEQLWRTIRHVESDSGEPFMPMDEDRYHLFGRDVVPLAFLAQIVGDRDAARAEANMAAQLGPYQTYPPEYQLTKFSGEAKYEPEARAELGISYLFHVWRAHHARAVEPVSQAEFVAAASGTTDYGEIPGMLAQNSPNAFAAAVSKPGYVKFVYGPNHDDWLFDVGGSVPSLLPSTAAKVTHRFAAAYSGLRDGVDATASLLTLSTGYAGYATLPGGAIVYATSGTGSGEGRLSVFNLNMPGIAGLDGSRTYTGANGAVTLTTAEAASGGINDLTFAAVSARYVRMLGITPGTQYGYSIYEFEVYAPGATTNLALGRPTTASSFTPAYPPAGATDGNLSTRWAVAVADRSVGGSWLQVDLGAATTIDHVTIQWEVAYGAAFSVQTSLDGSTWSDAITLPVKQVVEGGWINIDRRAGFVVRGSANPLTATPSGVTLSDGPASGAAGMVVEGYPAQPPSATGALAARPVPNGGPTGLAASVAEGHLSLFDLGGHGVTGPLTLPRQGSATPLYRGTQTTTDAGSVYEVELAAATAAVEPPRFTLAGETPGRSGAAGVLPAGVVAAVLDSQRVTLTAPAAGGCRVTLTSSVTGERRTATLHAGESKGFVFGGPLTPTADLALGRTTYPTSPLPPGMSAPAHAVDGDPRTAWAPGHGGGRLVVDLGATTDLSTLTPTWTPGRVRPFTAAVSTDGLAWTAAPAPAAGRGAPVPLHTAGRYVALDVADWAPGDAALVSLSVAG